eukprot:Hpha_TRINITY_DN11507_c0_g1::TRINITY_DN11507_c0_g1_i2::g.32146::m.32146
MGGEQSSLPCEGEWGFQVTLVAPGSPACDAGLVPFFDFIVHMDNFNLRGDHTRFFIEYMQRNKGQPVRLRVFNLKLRESREVTVTPRDDWGGSGLLGCSIAWNEVSQAGKCVWHITDVYKNSPG